MVKLGLVLIVAVSCFTVEALLSQQTKTQQQQNNESPGLEEVQGKCTPGKFYKRGCKHCFCDDKQRPVCGGDGDCKLVNKHPTNPRALRTYSRPELLKLPALSHQGANCTPGVTFRVECNACVCLANKNLMCDGLLCPSFEDVNRIKANSLTGQPCTAVNMNHECIDCTCVKGALKCEAKPKCIPTDGRRDLGEEPPLDLDVKTDKRQCTKGMVYKRDCNRCYCQKDNSLRCTLMRCLKHTEVERLKVLRMQLENNGL